MHFYQGKKTVEDNFVIIINRQYQNSKMLN